MGNRSRGYDASVLELLPLDAYSASHLPPPAAARKQAGGADARAIREAYLQARFPGVIRCLEDLDDATRVADAVHCYVLDGREDRAAELRRVAGLAQDPPVVRSRAGHAARLHRKLSAWTAR